MEHNVTNADGSQSQGAAGRKVIEVITENRTLTAADSGKTFLVATDGLVITLPPTEEGLEFEFINSGAAGNNIITISPAAADGIAGKFTLASSVVVADGTVNKDIINTKATSITGDHVEILGTGVTGTTAYLITHSSGIWARQA